MPGRSWPLARVAPLVLGLAALGGVACGVAYAPPAREPDRAEVAGPEVAVTAPTSAPSEEDPPPVPWPMGWCAAWSSESVETASSAPTRAHGLTGRVVRGGEGVPPPPCSYVSKYAANLDEDALPDPSWVVLRERESGRELTVAVALEGFALPARPGQTLAVTERLTRGPSLSGALLVRDGSGAPLLWMGAEGELDQLNPPGGLRLGRGDPTASGEWSCGTWGAYALTVGEAPEAVGYGQRLRRADHEVFHGGLLRDLLVDRCARGSMAQSWVAIRWARAEATGKREKG